jgi:4-diphosphocytidyl-2-C-methyl-D-erythritol kinase
LSSESFTLSSFAKINWVLRVLGRRADGYHEIDTIFQTITLQDRLTFARSRDERVNLTCDVPEIPVDEKNLIVQAALKLRKSYGINSGATIHLDKRIPTQAGLGGGSSNAATALLGLVRMWEIQTTHAQLEEIAAGLGADVPFFLTGGTARGTGLGSSVSALPDVAEKHLVVVMPNVKVSTAEAYKALSSPALTKPKADSILSSSRPQALFPDLSQWGPHNDFEPVIFALEPEILQAREDLLTAGAQLAMLAGSGASVFGVFENVKAQEHAASALAAESGWRVFKCATLSRASYLKELGACAAPLLSASPVIESLDIGA